MNHLAKEKSPYLLQHADNPVDWYPWGAEAFAKAEREKKPIFLSIGYSTCHWCHVMERESFAKPETAKILNEHFVSIKVDREERPDVDRVYMTAVQALTGQGGWPLNAFLTPERKPFFGGTYFPPDSRWGRPGFGDLLLKIAELWKEDREKVLDSGEQLAGAICQYAAMAAEPGELSPGLLEGGLRELKDAYDPERGGFGGAPKFPMPVYLNFLARRAADPDALKMLTHSLKAMAGGGIRDQIGGGFHRYSTDERWHIPHFEKMLYDNAQLMVNYVEAFQLTRDPEFAEVARDTAGYLLRDLSNPDGGFFSAEDADSIPPSRAEGEKAEEPKEGAFYAWTMSEISSVVGAENRDVVAFLFGAEERGNALSDPHGEFEGLNILYQAHTIAEAARRFKRSEKEIAEILAEARQRLFRHRAERPRPLRDDKLLASWNGLAISAFAKAGAVLSESAYVEAARAAARFLEKSLWDEKERRLYRRFRQGERNIAGTSDDYLFVAQGLIDLYEADLDLHWLEWALELAERAIDLFYDSKAGGFFMAAEDGRGEIFTRMKEDSDNVEPSASSVGALVLLRLAALFERGDLRGKAEKTLKLFAKPMAAGPRGQAQMLSALDHYLSPSRHIVIVGEKGAKDTRLLLEEARLRFQPRTALLVLDEQDRKRLAGRLSLIRDMKKKGGRATAYVCVDSACREPVNEPQALAHLLGG